MGKKLFVRGDDAGGCESANIAMAACLDAGILKNVGVMACGLAFDHATSLLASRKDACFGLHVCLNAEWDLVKWGPVLGADAVPNLIDANGHFLPTPMANHERGLDLDQAMAEVRAQLAKLREAGFDVQYLDQHMGIGWVGGLDEALVSFMAEEGLFSARDLPYLADAPLQEDPVEHFLARISASADGSLVVFHPGLDRPDMQEYFHVGLEPGFVARERGAETALLTDPRLRAGLEELGVQCCSYREA